MAFYDLFDKNVYYLVPRCDDNRQRKLNLFSPQHMSRVKSLLSKNDVPSATSISPKTFSLFGFDEVKPENSTF